MKLKNFNQFINENSSQERGAFREILDPKLRYDYLHDLMVNDYDAFEKECNTLAAEAIGCDPSEIHFIGSPTNDDIEPSDWVKVKDLLDGNDFDLKKPGELLWWFSVPAPDGYMAAYLFRHNGNDIIMYDAEDGPFIYLRDPDLKIPV
jgi:hypothetical protein